MDERSLVYVGIDTAKAKLAVALAQGGRNGELRYLGEIDNSPAAVERLVRKLEKTYKALHVCYEAGPTGYGLYRQIRSLGHGCDVVAPSLVPTHPGERVKTNRRDAVTLARLLRAGELTPIWVPDEVHEAVRDLVRAREAASWDLRRKRQQLLSFFGTGAASRAVGTGAEPMHAGLPGRPLLIRPSRSSSRIRSMPLRTPRPASSGWTGNWLRSCLAGRWRQWWPRIRPCAASPSWWL